MASSLRSMANSRRATHMPASILFERATAFCVAACENASVFADSVEVEGDVASAARGAAGLAKEHVRVACLAFCKRAAGSALMYALRPRAHCCCPSVLRGVHKTRHDVANSAQATEEALRASLGQLSKEPLLQNLAQMRHSGPEMSKFYRDRLNGEQAIRDAAQRRNSCGLQFAIHSGVQGLKETVSEQKGTFHPARSS